MDNETYGTQEQDDEPYGGQEQKNNDDLDKTSILERVFEKGLRIPDGDLAEIFDLSVDDVKQIKINMRKRATETSEKPLTYDYAFVFEVGDPDKKRKPTKSELKLKPDIKGDFEAEWEHGVSQRKYYGQIMQEMKEDLERARLTVIPFRSANDKYVVFAVGITEKALESWANDRDTDLLLDPVESVQEGRRKEFPLAKRTVLDKTTNDQNETLPLENWHSMYAQYNPRANKKIYKHYPRISSDENSPMTPFDEKTRLRIIYEAIISDKGEGGAEVELVDHLQSGKHPLKACFPLHNQAVLDEFEEEWLKNCHPRIWMNVPLERIREYFGEPVAFYFGFMMFYCRWLLAPSFLGFIFFWVQIAAEQVDVPGIFVLSFFIIGWCVAFVDFWFRQESRYRLQWGMTKFEEKAVSRPQFKGEWQHDDVTGLWVEDYWVVLRNAKTTCTMGGILIFLTMCIAGVVVILLFRDNDPKEIQIKVGAGVLNGVLIFIFDMIYRYLSRLGNEWENWRTEQEYQDALITKSFFFKFFNSFSSLFYLAFVRSLVSGTGFYISVYGSVCPACGDDDNGWDPENRCRPTINLSSKSPNPKFEECCIELANYCNQTQVQNQINRQILKDLQIQLASLFVTAVVIQNTLEVGLPFLFEYIKQKKEESEAREKGEEVKPKSDAEEQSDLAPYENTIDDMAEIIIQFGYVTLFVMCLPLTPLLALINNMIELKVDGTNLVKSSQRPHPNGSFGLGAWNGVLSFFSVIAVGTNVALLVFRTSLVPSIVGSGSIATKWIVFSILSIILALVVGAEKALIPDVPTEVKQGVARQRVIESVLVNHAIVDDDGDEPPKTSEDDEDFKFDPTLPYVTPSDLELAPTGRMIFLETETQTSTSTEP